MIHEFINLHSFKKHHWICLQYNDVVAEKSVSCNNRYKRWQFFLSLQIKLWRDLPSFPICIQFHSSFVWMSSCLLPRHTLYWPPIGTNLNDIQIYQSNECPYLLELFDFQSFTKLIGFVSNILAWSPISQCPVTTDTNVERFFLSSEFFSDFSVPAEVFMWKGACQYSQFCSSPEYAYVLAPK